MTDHLEAIGSFDEAVDQFDRQRQVMLADLIEELVRAGADPERADFGRVFKHSCRVLGKTDLQMSGLFKISRPTVGRWARGVTAPHPILRKAVFDTLVVEAKRALKSRPRVD
jgi:hypothetical protein